MSALAYTRQGLAAAAGICALSLLLPSPARAAPAPPGNAAVQEFVESLPDGTGLRTTNDVADFRAEALRSGRVVRGRTRRALARDGESVVSLAQASGPQPSGSKRRRSSAGEGESPLAAVLKRVAASAGPGGLGAVLPLTLVLAVLAAWLYAMRRGQLGPAATAAQRS